MDSILRDLGSFNAQLRVAISALLTILLIAWQRERPLDVGEISVLAITAALMLYAERFAPLYLIAATPLALRNGFRTPSMNLRIFNSPIVISIFAYALLVPNCVAVVEHVVHDPHVALPNRPGLLVSPDWLEASRIGNPARERVYCSDFAYCSSYLWLGARVLLDGRADPFPLRVYKSTMRINHLDTGWQSDLASYDVNVLVIDRGMPKLDEKIASISAWKKVATTPRTDTYILRGTNL